MKNLIKPIALTIAAVTFVFALTGCETTVPLVNYSNYQKKLISNGLGNRPAKITCTDNTGKIVYTGFVSSMNTIHVNEPQYSFEDQNGNQVSIDRRCVTVIPMN